MEPYRVSGGRQPLLEAMYRPIEKMNAPLEPTALEMSLSTTGTHLSSHEVSPARRHATYLVNPTGRWTQP